MLRPGKGLALFSVLLLGLYSCRTFARRHGDFSKGIWVTRWDFKTKEDVKEIIANISAMGFDHVLFQVRGEADALYASKIEPWCELLGKDGPGFDPLEAACTECARRGIKLHAWVNVVPGWRGDKPPASKKHVFHRHPEWFMKTRDGKWLRLRKNYYSALNICLPEVRKYICSVIRDIAERYDVSGIHLDYIRFMERRKGEDFPYDKKTLRLFKKETGLAPGEDPGMWDLWRRDCVTRLVAGIRDTLGSLKRNLTLSAAVFKDFVKARERVFQDAVTWAERGLVDRVYLMNYERKDNSRFERYVRESLVLKKYGVKVYQGLGAWLHAKNPGFVAKEIGISRKYGCDGISIFAYAALFPSRAPAGGLPGLKERERLRMSLRPLLGLNP